MTLGAKEGGRLVSGRGEDRATTVPALRQGEGGADRLKKTMRKRHNEKEQYRKAKLFQRKCD